MNTRDILLDLIHCNFDGRGWYGGNLLAALRTTDFKLANRQPPGGLKTIHQQALHAAYWKYRTLRTLSGDTSRKFAYRGTNWPVVPLPASAEAWKQTIAYVRSLQRELIAVVQSMPAKQLESAITVRRIHGIASHDVYHNAQIRHLRKLLSPKKR